MPELQAEPGRDREGRDAHGRVQVSTTMILGRRTRPLPPLRIPDRVPHCFTQEPSTDRAHLRARGRVQDAAR